MFKAIFVAGSSRGGTRVRIGIVGAVVLISLVGMALTKRALVHSKNRSQAAAEVILSQSPQRNRVLPIQNIRFTIYPEGVYPRKARAHKGPVSIQVEDLTGGTSTLLVERLTASGRVNVGQARRLGKHLRGRSVLELTPGRYRLRIAERPAREAELIVEP